MSSKIEETVQLCFHTIILTDDKHGSTYAIEKFTSNAIREAFDSKLDLAKNHKEGTVSYLYS